MMNRKVNQDISLSSLLSIEDKIDGPVNNAMLLCFYCKKQSEPKDLYMKEKKKMETQAKDKEVNYKFSINLNES